MSTYTTHPPAINITELVPELAPFARTTVRLHPHRLLTDLPADSSKFGGEFLWPADEEWPVHEREELPFVGVLQLRQADVPEMQFMPGTDLFQLLWCPCLDTSDTSRSKTYWRNTSQIGERMLDIPQVSAAELEYDEVRESFPNNCSIHPERVLEYPDPDQLYWWAGKEQSEQILAKIGQADFRPPDSEDSNMERILTDERIGYYWSHLAQCPGAKLMGGGTVEKDGKPWEHLLTLDSDEYCYPRWQPLEDREEVTGQPFYEMKCPLGMTFGRSQKLLVWICRELPGWPISMNIYG